jgi:DNA-binding response OmpR family regulator
MTNILIVDDEPGIREISARILEHAGYTVDVAEDGERAWEAVVRKNYDLIVTDQNMPRLDGTGLIARLDAAGMRMPVIMMTGTVLEMDSLKTAPDSFLAKPFSFFGLIAEVNRLLSRETVSM